jgi:hypothetical protein
VAVQASIFRFVDHTHATDTEFVDDVIMRDGLIEQAKKNSIPSAAILGVEER